MKTILLSLIILGLGACALFEDKPDEPPAKVDCYLVENDAVKQWIIDNGGKRCKVGDYWAPSDGATTCTSPGKAASKCNVLPNPVGE